MHKHKAGYKSLSSTDVITLEEASTVYPRDMNKTTKSETQNDKINFHVMDDAC